MRLADSLEEVGLIYIGCHGTEGQGGQDEAPTICAGNVIYHARRHLPVNLHA